MMLLFQLLQQFSFICNAKVIVFRLVSLLISTFAELFCSSYVLFLF